MFRWLRRGKYLSRQHARWRTTLDPSLFDEPAERFYPALAAYWSTSDPDYETQGPSAFVGALEERYSLSLPEDFRSYLLHAAPSTSFMDDTGTQWWSVREVRSLVDECPDVSPGRPNVEIEQQRHAYLVFSDFLFWAYGWAICCSDGLNRGKIALIGGLPDGFVADSFRQFLFLALADAPEVHRVRGRTSADR
jgi:hypothetical protein